MTSCANGIDTGYQSIANNYLYLNVNDSDRIYGTDVTIGDLQKIGVSEELYNDRTFISNLIRQNSQNRYNITLKEEPSSTVYDVLSSYNELSDCKKFIDSANYGNELRSRNTTFFAFTNANSKLADEWVDQCGSSSYKTELLKAHTLGFIAEPSFLKNRIIKLFSKSEGNELYVNGQAKPMYLYDDNKELNGVSFSNPLLKNNITAFITCDNGLLYVIDRPIYPQIVI